MGSIKDKVAVVTGSTRGIGRAIAEALAGQGARVVVSARSPADVERAVDEMRQAGHDVRGKACDVRKYSDAESLMRFAAEGWGGLDILVNNAGIGIFGHVAEMSPEEWDQVIDTNLTGVFYCCRAAIPFLRQRGGGYIINISSLAGSNPFVGGVAYCASKAAVDVFSEALMQEVRHDGIRVSYIKPGSVNTDFMGQADPDNEWKLRPEDVAQVVVDLVSHDQRSLPSRVDMRPSRPPKK